MKKNKMMRTAAVLGVAALLTTSALSGTLAKYTTTAEGTDSARVAKWGVTITMADDDSIFKSTYAKASSSTSTSIENTVVASNHSDGNVGDKIVAPGTSGETTFSIKGTPEVAFALNVKIDDDSKKTIHIDNDATIDMKAGEFEDKAVKVKTTAAYEPIKFTLSKKTGDDKYEPVTKSGNNQSAKAENMTLAELEKELEDLSTSYAANTTVNAEYKISWKWDFETSFTNYSSDNGFTSNYSNADILDTYLGNQENAQTEAYKITITATQID